jgi:hypothetical protein
MVSIASKYHWHDKIMKDVGGAFAILLRKIKRYLK